VRSDKSALLARGAPRPSGGVSAPPPGLGHCFRLSQRRLRLDQLGVDKAMMERIRAVDEGIDWRDLEALLERDCELEVAMAILR